ncbi:MAG: MSHA biogenesis protein MshO [Methylophagaceae bacterium]|jgi:MSHA biogenesis protein MshO
MKPNRPPVLKNQAGFSLIELVIVIVLSAILASMAASVLKLPIRAYVDSARRASLSDTAESAIRRMQRDIRRALPNSIRISPDQTTLELLHLIDGGRYRAVADNTTSPPTGDILNFDIADTTFDVLGELNSVTNISVNNDSLVVYPLNSIGNNPYDGDNTTVITAATTNTLTFNAFQFPLRSPNQRFFVIDTPITYRCNTAAVTPNDKTLLRYDNYIIQSAQPLIPNVTPAIQANQVAACRFSFNSGSNTRSAVVTVELTLTDESGESINLLHQVHLDNQP